MKEAEDALAAMKSQTGGTGRILTERKAGTNKKSGASTSKSGAQLGGESQEDAVARATKMYVSRIAALVKKTQVQANELEKVKSERAELLSAKGEPEQALVAANREIQRLKKLASTREAEVNGWGAYRQTLIFN